MNREKLISLMESAGLKLDAYDSKAALAWYPEIERLVKLVAEDCAEACQARYMGDNTREDMEARRCAEAIKELYK